MGALSRGHHTLKTEGWTDITESNADGSAVYVTVLGQRIPAPPLLGEPPHPTNTEAAETPTPRADRRHCLTVWHHLPAKAARPGCSALSGCS